ncbi:hypothetical protein TrRE_jg13389 [Triparma retinervis]|uniref:Uncharacterized protein n=1 Tax=Triparma retinervis TaxID=2557542 RepID=A0A9W7A1X9_9STRA|nr:hypothetical protein TrRE_jg13389 [Triparma retinervis]
MVASGSGDVNIKLGNTGRSLKWNDVSGGSGGSQKFQIDRDSFRGQLRANLAYILLNVRANWEASERTTYWVFHGAYWGDLFGLAWHNDVDGVIRTEDLVKPSVTAELATPPGCVVAVTCRYPDGTEITTWMTLLKHSARDLATANSRVLENAASMEFLMSEQPFPIPNEGSSPKTLKLIHDIVMTEEVDHQADLHAQGTTLQQKMTAYVEKTNQSANDAKPFIEFDKDADKHHIDRLNKLKKSWNDKDPYERFFFGKKPLSGSEFVEADLPDGWGISRKGCEPHPSKKRYLAPEYRVTPNNKHVYNTLRSAFEMVAEAEAEAEATEEMG